MNGILFKSVDFQYTRNVIALSNVSLHIQVGEIIGIMGRNGAGKSTLIQLMNGLLKPTKGTVIIDGISTINYNPAELTRKIGIMFQNPEHQLFSNTVEEEIDFSLKNLRISKEQKNQYKHEIIKELDLYKLLDKSPWNCSGGERKKISIASVLCRKPDVLVFDEPTLGQDKFGYQILENVLNKAILNRKTIIIVTHNTEFALKYLKRIIILDKGRILADGPTREILTNSMIREQSSFVLPQFYTFQNMLMNSIPEYAQSYHPIRQAINFDDLKKVIFMYARRENDK